jgi:hypothetical protein
MITQCALFIRGTRHIKVLFPQQLKAQSEGNMRRIGILMMQPENVCLMILDYCIFMGSAGG